MTFDDNLLATLRANFATFTRSDSLNGERTAAVAVTIVCGDQGEAQFVLTRRSPKLRKHAGQWALPGGRIDGNETAAQAALRELDEEVGVAVEPGAIIGQLDDYATRSGFIITPVVVWAGQVDLVPNPDEVDVACALPIADLNRDDAPIIEQLDDPDRPLIMMPLMGGVVFAPTAAILFQFREVGLRGTHTRVAHFDQPKFAWK